VERLIVWGLIAALLVVVFLEGRARLAYSQTVSRIQAAMAEAESLESSNLLIENIPALLAGSPSVSKESRRFDQVNHYQWNGLFKKYGLHVSYGTYTRIVTGMSSDDAPPAPTMRVNAHDPNDPVDHGEGGPPGEGGGGPGGPSGGPRPDPMLSDANGDGKLSKEEVTGRLAEFFDRIDADTDGFLTPEELAARRGRRPPGEAGAGTGEGDAAPQRPPLDEPTDAAPPAQTPAAPAPDEGTTPDAAATPDSPAETAPAPTPAQP
jgi:hypothetical protein